MLQIEGGKLLAEIGAVNQRGEDVLKGGFVEARVDEKERP